MVDIPFSFINNHDNNETIVIWPVLKFDTLSVVKGRAASRSEISWKADFTAVALGNEDG